MLLNALLGQQNPLAQWASGNNNFLTALGAGIASGPDLASGIGAGLRAAPQAKMADMEAAQQREEKARQTQQQNATKALLMEKAPDLAQLLDTGIPMGEVWGEYLRRQQPQGPVKPIEVNGQLIDPNTLQVLGDFRTPQAASSNMPALVQEYEYAKSQGFEGSMIDYQQAKGRNSGTPPATIAKEIFEADEGAQAGQNVIMALDKALELNKTAGDGPFADTWSAGAALFGDQQAVQTQELKNIVTANALESLKATFGAAPTEGERKILLEIQGSVNQSRPVREAIFKRAKAAAERRLKFNQERGGALRGGNYFDPGYSPVGGAPAGNVDDILGKYGL